MIQEIYKGFQINELYNEQQKPYYNIAKEFQDDPYYEIWGTDYSTISEAKKGGTKFGYVGKIIEGIEVKIAKDGEILCKGPNVMKGYFKDSNLTAKTIKNGFLYTGDIGEIDKEGFLKITDRKKQLFKTSGGKYIAPQVIENKMKRSPFIEQVMVIGEGEKMPSALIQPDFQYVKNWLLNNKFPFSDDLKKICLNNELLKKINLEINKIDRFL